MKTLLTFLLNRLKDRNTWTIAVPLIFTAVGAQLNPDLGELITNAGLGLVGIVAFFLKTTDTPAIVQVAKEAPKV